MGTLRFSVVACTSEDASFPASELEQHQDRRRGYMTAKNWSYPQELILALPRGLCHVTRMQVLAHETSIATKIEVFGATSRSFDRETTGFRRLGFLTLKDNIETKYRARELKTVQLNQAVALLKLRIHTCYVNKHNLDRQVGIMAINLYGDPLGILADHLMEETVADCYGQDKCRDDTVAMRVDATMAARIREIQVAKDQAVKREDYDQAKRLKEMEKQVKSIRLELARLEAEKRRAVANEDYDLAKEVKLKIGRLEASVMSNESQPILPLKTVASSQLRDEAVHRSLPRGTYSEAPQVAERESFYGGGNASLWHSVQGSYRSGNEQDACSGGDHDTDQEDGIDGGQNPHFRGIPEAANLPDPEEIPPELAKESEELISVIGPFITRCFYSNLWNHRDAAIRKVAMEMNKYPVEPIRLLEVCSKLAQSGAGDRIVQVALSAFGLLDQMVLFGARVCHDDMCRILGNSTTQLVNKLGGSQAKVRDEAVAVLRHLAAAENVGVAFVASHLTKRSKKPLGLRILQGRLFVLKRLLAEFELVLESAFSAPSIMGFLEDSYSLAHQCRAIRDAAKDITVSLYRAVGAEVKGYLKCLRPKQLEEYQAAFKAAERDKVLHHSSIATAATAGSGSVPHRNEERYEIEAQFECEVEGASDSEDEESVDECTCPFCGVVNEEYLDQHFWESCRMLSPCKMCGQVVEIASLNEHLLAECEMQQNHRECLRCGEAIVAKFYERHVSLNDCPQRAPLNRANRCPLCHDDIAPGKKGWRLHLLKEGCPKNPRS